LIQRTNDEGATMNSSIIQQHINIIFFVTVRHKLEASAIGYFDPTTTKAVHTSTKQHA